MIQICGITKTKDNEFKITTTTNAIALFIWLDTEIPGRFSENGFQQVTASKEVYFLSDRNISAGELFNSLTVIHYLHNTFL